MIKFSTMRDEKVDKKEILSTKSKIKGKRITKQVRIGLKMYGKLKEFAIENNITMSKSLDKIVTNYLRIYGTN